jgi:hypothetical protein
MKKRLFRILLCSVYIFTAIDLHAALYVATNGNDSNPGSLASPWRSIQHAVNSAAAGDVIYVRTGTYAEQVNVTHSGADGQSISIENYPGERPVVDSGFTKEYGFNITGNYIRIKGFEIRNCKGNSALSNARGHVAGIGVYSSNVTIEENIIHNIIGGPRQVFGIIIATSGGGYLIQNNTIYLVNGNPEAFGIWVWAPAGTVIRKNLVYFCDKVGIRFTSQSYAAPPVILRNELNVIEGNITIHNHYSLDFNMAYGQSGKLLARNNFSGWNWGMGQMVKHTRNVILQHNTYYKNGEHGIDFHGVGGSSDKLMQNVDAVVKDNLLSDNRNGLLIHADPNYPQNFGETVDYNFYSCPAGGILGLFSYNPGATPYSTIQAFAVASNTVAGLDHAHTPYEQHGRQDNSSQFIAPENFDLRLKAASPAKAMADDGLDAGALESELTGVGAEKNFGLDHIPDVHMLPLTVESFSSEASSGRAASIVDNSYLTYWQINTASDPTREIVFTLPGADVYSLSAILLSKHDSGESYYYKQFALYVDDGSGSWKAVAAPPEHPFLGFTGLYNGEIWRLPAQPLARRVKVKIINGYSSGIRIPDIRIYGEKQQASAVNNNASSRYR